VTDDVSHLEGIRGISALLSSLATDQRARRTAAKAVALDRAQARLTHAATPRLSLLSPNQRSVNSRPRLFLLGR
jgi:hypothetical protein